MKIEPRLLKGFRDFLPEDMLLRNKVIGIIKEVFELHGFLPLETPTLEHLDILTGKYGDEGEKLIFNFKDQGDRDVAMRYDLTVPLARVVAQYQELPKPFKRYQIQPVWRADKPQKGRFREFYQCDVDILGSESRLADAEILSVVYHSLKELGFREFLIKINDRRLLNAMVRYTGKSDDAVVPFCRSMDKLDKIGVDGVKKELQSSGFSSEQIEKVFKVLSPGLEKESFDINEVSKLLAGDDEADAALEDLKKIFSYLDSLGVEKDAYIFDLSLARGLDYYTGTVFETVVTRPKVGSITGGGRYDELVGVFTSQGLPAVGTSLGLERIIEVINEHGFINAGQTVAEALVVNFGDDVSKEGLKLVKILRESGIPSEIYPDSAKLGKQFKYADKMGIPAVLICGTDEITRGTVVVKNMKTGGQEEIKQTALVSHLRNLETKD